MGTSRHALYFSLCNDLSGTYVEVGTCWGAFAKWLLNSTPLTELVCVDPYRVFDEKEYTDALNDQSQLDLDMKFEMVKIQLNDVGNRRVRMLRTTSTEAAATFPDESLSFVYIDANHAYKYTKQDIEAWIGKVRPGGILAGDDVESLDLPHEENDGKDAMIVHAVHLTGKIYGLYGVHTALVDFKADNPWFDYTVSDGQFWWRKPCAP